MNKQCDICKQECPSVYIDGRTKMGPWANMCVACHKRVGVGLGLGKGQRYELQPDPVSGAFWSKVAG